MAIAVYPWIFRQLGPPGKTLKLEGPNAPFGRPRHGAVAEEELELRDSETYYPGNPVPDRHVFGDRQTPIVLSGRWMDSRIGFDGGAQLKVAEVKSRIKERVRVHFEWGPLVAGTGLLHKLKIGWESSKECVWTLTIKVDQDDTTPINGTVPIVPSASAMADQIARRFSTINSTLPDIPADIDYQPGFLDSLAQIVSNLNSYSAAISLYADSVDNFESALASDVAHLRGGIAQYATAAEQLQITLESAGQDAALQFAPATSQVTWYDQRAAMEEALLEILAILASMDLAAEIAQKGTPDRIYVVAGGDTWESIALAQLGDVGKADALRQASAIRYSTPPSPGQVLHLPKIT